MWSTQRHERRGHMPIDDGLRTKLAPGTQLRARYKSHDYAAEVIAGADGIPRYRLANGREFTSPSAAGQAVMNGVACNGWRFWSLAEQSAGVSGPTMAPLRGTGGTPSSSVRFCWVPNQRGVPAGEVRWFCPACPGSFVTSDGKRPLTCPNQHREAADRTRLAADTQEAP